MSRNPSSHCGQHVVKTITAAGGSKREGEVAEGERAACGKSKRIVRQQDGGGVGGGRGSGR